MYSAMRPCSSDLDYSDRYEINDDTLQQVTPEPVRKASDVASALFGKSYKKLLLETSEREKLSYQNNAVMKLNTCFLGTNTCCYLASIFYGTPCLVAPQDLLAISGGLLGNVFMSSAIDGRLENRINQNVSFLKACDKVADFYVDCDSFENNPNEKNLRKLIEKLNEINALFKDNANHFKKYDLSSFPDIRTTYNEFYLLSIEHNEILNESENNIFKIIDHPIHAEINSSKKEMQADIVKLGKRFVDIFKSTLEMYVSEVAQSYI